jgi:hypothetical protein
MLAGPVCSARAPHDAFGYNPWVAFISGTIVFIAALILFRQIERQLTHSNRYLAGRHAWRCAFPGALFLLYLHSSDQHSSISVPVQVAVAVGLGVLAHFLFTRLPKVTSATPEGAHSPDPDVYRIGGLVGAVAIALYTCVFLLSGTLDLSRHLLPLAGTIGENQIESRDYLARHGSELSQVAGSRRENIQTTGDAQVGDCVVSKGTTVEVQVYGSGVQAHILDGDCHTYQTVEFPVSALPMNDLVLATIRARQESREGHMVTLKRYLHDPVLRQQLGQRSGILAKSAGLFFAASLPGEQGSGFACEVPGNTPILFKAYLDNTGYIKEPYSAVVSLPGHVCPGMGHQVFIAPMSALPAALRLQNLH